jgi:hypothetical protein
MQGNIKAYSLTEDGYKKAYSLTEDGYKKALPCVRKGFFILFRIQGLFSYVSIITLAN